MKRPPQLWRYTKMLDSCSAHVDQFVSPSQFTSRKHAERGFRTPVAHLPYFIERVDEEWINPPPRPQEKPYFLFVGRLEKIKGLQDLIRIWHRVPDFDLLVAGTGTEAEQLRAEAAGQSRIKFLGALSQRDLGSLYYHALACIVPSVTFETFGIIIIEAFARKTPVIVRDLGALPEVVNESRGGYTFRTDDELINAINKLGHAPTLRAEFGENGYQAFIKNWTREAHLNLYFDFLRNVAINKFGSVPWEDKPVMKFAENRYAPQTQTESIQR